MNRPRKTITVEGIQRGVLEVYNGSPVLQELRARLDLHGLKGWLFGGAVRVIAAHGEWARPRDLDIIVEGNQQAYEAMMTELSQLWSMEYRGDEQEGSGGMSRILHAPEVDVDCWHLSTQHGVFHLPESEQRIELVPGTTFLTCDSILVTFGGGPGPDSVEVLDGGFLECWNSGTIGMRLGGENSRETMMIKALVTSRRFGLWLAPDLRRWCGTVLREMSLNDLVTRLKVRYGHIPDLGDFLEVVEASWEPRP